MGSNSTRQRIVGVPLAIVLAIGAVGAAGSGAEGAQSTSSGPVTIVFKAQTARFEPQPDGSTRLVLEGMAPKARIDAPDAPKGVDPTLVLEADADGAVTAQVAAKQPTGGDPIDVALTDVRYESDDSISAVVRADSDSGDSALPAAALFDVTLTAEVDRPSESSTASTTTTSTPARVPRSTAGAGSGGYVVTMPWTAAKYREMSIWIFEPVDGTKQCVDNERATETMTIIKPTGGRGWPHADIDFAFVVNNDGDCFWKSSSMEFWVKTGTDSFDAGSCKYEVKQIGPRTFQAKVLRQSSNTLSCDASGGINVISGYLTGKELD